MTDNFPTLRKKANITQAELAGMIGVSEFAILSIEKRQRRMTWNIFLSLMLVFTKNKETDRMLTLFGIYTDEFNCFIKNREEKEY